MLTVSILTCVVRLWAFKCLLLVFWPVSWDSGLFHPVDIRWLKYDIATAWHPIMTWMRRSIILDTYHIYDGGHIQVHKNIDWEVSEHHGPHSGILRVVLVQAEIFKKIIFGCMYFRIIAVMKIRQRPCAYETFGNTAEYILQAHSERECHV